MGLRVALACPGLGHVRRGHERFTEGLARALGSTSIELRVYGASVPEGVPGRSVPTLRRGWLERLGRGPAQAYRNEQLAFGAALVPALLAFRPHLVQVSDPALASALFHARRLLHSRFRILFSNGGQAQPEHYARFDHVQLVGPWQLEAALAFGFPRDRLTVLPLGVEVRSFRPRLAAEDLRASLGLPTGRLLVSVASLDASVKRLDYLIAGLARAPAAWSLVCVGQRTAETVALEALAARLAPGRILMRTARPEDVPDYLGAADAFTLASASEGFGLAVVEAMAAGLPVLVRDIPSLRAIVDDPGQVAPLDDPGELAAYLDRISAAETRRALGERNRAHAEAYDWGVVLPGYVEMYARACAAAVPSEAPARP